MWRTSQLQGQIEITQKSFASDMNMTKVMGNKRFSITDKKTRSYFAYKIRNNSNLIKISKETIFAMNKVPEKKTVSKKLAMNNSLHRSLKIEGSSNTNKSQSSKKLV